MIDASHLNYMRKLKNPFVIDVAKNNVTLVRKYSREKRGMSNRVVLLPEWRETLLSVKKLSHAGIDVLFTGQIGQDHPDFRKNGNLVGAAYLWGNI